MIEGLTPEQVSQYLARVEFEPEVGADVDSLRRLHRSHLRHVPFECLDVHRGKPLSLEPQDLCDKVLQRRRGGFCYELNSLFGRLLVSLGFEVELLAARVVDREGALGPPFDHMALRVFAGRWYLCDVGFGRNFLDPFALDCDEHEDESGRYRLVASADPPSEDGLWLEHHDGERWQRTYLLDPTPRRLSEFLPMFAHHQHDPRSPFPRTFLITQLTEDGRLTVRDLEVTETTGGKQTRWVFENSAARDRHVAEHFGEQFSS